MNDVKKYSHEISIIVPVYNKKKYLPECIKSILSQTFADIELVLVDDGSTDASVGIIDSCAKNNENVIAVHQKNAGLNCARICGLNHASGRFIGWVDADDFVEKDMFEKLYNLAVSQNADYAYCNYNYYPNDISHKAKWFKNYYGQRDWNFIERNSQCTNTLTLRALLDEINIIEKWEKFFEYGWISVLLSAKKIAVLDEELYHYRVGEVSMSGGGLKGKVKHYEYNAVHSRNLVDICKNTAYEGRLDDYFQYRYIYTLILLALVAAANGDRKIYNKSSNELKNLKYMRNKYTRIILDNNHGKLYSFFLRIIVPNFYSLTKFASRFY